MSTPLYLSLLSLLACCSIAPAQEEWGLTPLGDTSKPEDYGIKRNTSKAVHTKAWRAVTPLAGEPLQILKGDKAVTCLILSANASKAAVQAAEEVSSALGRVNGTPPPIYREQNITLEQQADGALSIAVADQTPETFASAIAIGTTQLSQKAQLSAGDLPAEGYRIVTQGPILYLLAEERNSAGQPVANLLHAAFDLLEHGLGFRWLWPGETGEVRPDGTDLVFSPQEITDAPLLKMRRMRNGLRTPTRQRTFDSGDPSHLSEEELPTGWHPLFAYLGFTPESFPSHQSEGANWFRRNRLGASLSLSAGHAYNWWFQHYGKEHPEWFALQGNGSRTQKSPRERLCVSHAGLIAQVARKTVEKAASTATSISISPNDGSTANSYCLCAACRRHDMPVGSPIVIGYKDAEGKRQRSSYVSLSDRYARFYSRVAQEVSRTRPNLLLTAYAYSHYRDAPLATHLHPNVVIGFVGLTYIDDVQRERDLANWKGWAERSNHLFFRPNFFHAGHGYPLAYPRRVAQDLRNLYQTGMIGADFDSVLHHWSTNGLNYYVVAKLLWNPYADVDAIIADYCRAGFGPAAAAVYEYFTLLENTTNEQAALPRQAEEGELRADEQRADARLTYAEIHGALAGFYTPERLATLRAPLARAKEQAAGDPLVLRRIAFLETGLDYALWQSRFYHANQERVKNLKALSKERLTFFNRLQREEPFAIGLRSILRREGGTLKRLHGPLPKNN